MEPTDGAIAAGRVLELAILYRLQAYAGPVSDEGARWILYRAAHGVLQVIEVTLGSARCDAAEPHTNIAINLPSGNCYHGRSVPIRKVLEARDHLTSHSAGKPPAS